MLPRKLIRIIFLVLFATSLVSSVFAARFYVQDTYLEQAKNERVRLTLTMTSGERLEGYIKSHDEDAVLLDAGNDILIYKNAIAIISSSNGTLTLVVPDR